VLPSAMKIGVWRRFMPSEEGMRESARRNGLRAALIAPHSVVDVGCRRGAWLGVCNDLGVAESWARRRLGSPKTSISTATISHRPNRPITVDARSILLFVSTLAEHSGWAFADVLVESMAKPRAALLFLLQILVKADLTT